MPLANGKELVALDFSVMNGGKANAYPGHAIAQNQVADCLNAIFEPVGFSRSPGYRGIKETEIFGGYIRGFYKYVNSTGSESCIAVSGGVVYSVNLSTGETTELYTLSGDGESYGFNAFGKLWICNGTDFVKIEGTDVYRVGINAPTGFSASATAGGTLPVGVYEVYASYVRKVSGLNVLYSYPQLVGTVTATLSNATVSVAVTASDDPQVDAIAIWMTDAGGATHYYYGEGPNSAGTIDISSNSNKNASLLMYESATPNSMPKDFVGIYCFDGRVFGWTGDNNLYFSMKAQNVYDLERYPLENVIPTIPFSIISLFKVGPHLFVNTYGGLYKIPYGDVGAKPEPVESQLYFPKYFQRTIQEYNGLAWGLTIDGFRYFDGERFSIDLTKHIKPDIDACLNGSTDDFYAFGHIHRRSGKRTEYHLTFRDINVSSNIHGRHLVLNLDTLTIVDNSNYTAAWEDWTPGFAFAFTLATGQMYIAQHTSAGGQISLESGKADIYCYNIAGPFQTTVQEKECRVTTRTDIQQLRGITLWERLYHLSTLNKNAGATILISDKNNYSYSGTMNASGGSNPPVFDAIILDVVLPAENPTNEPVRLPVNARGNSIALKISQTSDDPTFFVYKLQLYGETERNNFT